MRNAAYPAKTPQTRYLIKPPAQFRIQTAPCRQSQDCSERHRALTGDDAVEVAAELADGLPQVPHLLPASEHLMTLRRDLLIQSLPVVHLLEQLQQVPGQDTRDQTGHSRSQKCTSYNRFSRI